MDKTKKMLLVVFATLLIMNLQFNTPLTKGMNDGFSLSQLVENVFVQESYAEGRLFKKVYCEDFGSYVLITCTGKGTLECKCSF